MSSQFDQDQMFIVDGRELKRLDVRPSLTSYIRLLWDRRDFILADARFKAFRTTRDYRLWQFWLVAKPLLDAAMYGLLFGVLLKTSRGVENYIGFIVIGITFFNFIAKIATAGGGLLKASKHFIQAFDFPRASIVFSTALRYLLDFLPPMIVAIVFGLVAQWEKPVNWTIVLSIPITLLMFVFAVGLMLIAARATTFIPDLRAVLDVLVRAWFFASGVFFSLERFATNPVVYEIMSKNPAYIYLESLRGAILYYQVPSWQDWLIMISWAVIVFLVGFVYFWQAEEKYVKEV